MRNYQIKKILKILLPIALLAVLVVLLLLILKKEEVITIKNLSPVPSPGFSKQNAIAQNNDKLVFSNGRQIVEFDLKTGTSKKVSKSLELPIISELKVSPNDGKIAFKTDLSIGDLALDTEDTPLWWILDKNTGEVSLVSGGSNAFEWIDESKYIVSEHNSKIALKNIRGEAMEDIYQSDDIITKIKAYENSVYVLSFDGKLTSINLGDKQSTLIKNNVLNAIFSEKEGCLFTVEGIRESEDSTNNLIGCGQDDKTLGENVFSPVFSTSGDSLIYGSYDEEDDSPIFFDLDLRSFEKKRLVFENFSADKEIELLWLESLDKILARNGDTLFASSGPSYSKINSPASFFINSISVDLDAKKQEATASKKTGVFSAQEIESVEKLLQQNNLNADLIYTSFLVIGDETNRWD